MTFESDSLSGDWNFTIEQKERLPGRKEWCEQRPRCMLGMGQPQREKGRKKVPGEKLTGSTKVSEPRPHCSRSEHPPRGAQGHWKRSGGVVQSGNQNSRGEIWMLFSCGVSKAILSFRRKPCYHKEGLEGDRVSG